MIGEIGSEAASSSTREFSSFRDPDGFLFWRQGQIYRRILPPHSQRFLATPQASLMAEAVAENLLLPFEMIENDGETAIIKPKQLSFISYPYEWSFDQLKDAALVTLDLHIRALKHGFLLKDASAYNIQFHNGRPCLIDHLSFDVASAHSVWPAYGQFCRHFLAPLAAMAYLDLSLGKISQLHIDGVPLDLVSTMLPRRTRYRPGLYLHLHLHARMQSRHAGMDKKVSERKLSASHMAAFASSLRSIVSGLEPKSQSTEWGSYYDATNYTNQAFEAKRTHVRELVSMASPSRVWDQGGNNGEFSRSISDLVQDIVCMDIDPAAVNQNYRICRDRHLTNILPLVLDVTNPTPAIGFASSERASLAQRGRADLILALALIHHLAISNNLPFEYIAEYFATCGNRLLIEFVAKSDSQVQRLLINRRDIFPNYNLASFKAAFERHFKIDAEREIPGTDRTLLLLSSCTAKN